MKQGLILACALAVLPCAAQEKPSPDALRSFTVNQEREGYEPPLTENEPVYFVMGTRGGTNARFQLSFKYRLFDRSLGWGRDQPWLSGLYLGYTQTTIWNLHDDSKPFRDTSY
ncbi:MAG TPA: phospholipase A, partial [Burkholderiales bacterium]|nr:phospholipase A [Burkholderiales bacterium]